MFMCPKPTLSTRTDTEASLLHFAAVAVFYPVGLCLAAAKALIDLGCYTYERIQCARGKCQEGKCRHCKD